MIKFIKKNACEPFHSNCYFILFTEGGKQWSQLKLHLCGISGKKLNKVSDMISSHGFYMFTGQSTLIMIAVYFFSIMTSFFAEKNQKQTLSPNGNKNIGGSFIEFFLYLI